MTQEHAVEKHATNPSMPTKFCPYCGESILAMAIKCRYCNEFLDGRKSTEAKHKKLEGYWYAIIWGALLFPFIGSWIIVFLSSILYYVWRSDQPIKAKTINIHGWGAWFVGNIMWLIIYLLLRV